MIGLTGSKSEVAAACVLVLLLAAGCVTDLRERRIPNSLAATVLLGGILVMTAFDPVIPGLLRACGGVAMGLALWLPGWLLRKMGAGDVKLFAAAGAWLGPAGSVNAAVAAAALGGVLALIWMLLRGRRATSPRPSLGAGFSRESAVDEASVARRELVPYSLAITGGVIVQLAIPGLLLG